MSEQFHSQIESHQKELASMETHKESPEELRAKIREHRATIQHAVDNGQQELKSAAGKLNSPEAKDYLSKAVGKLAGVMARIAENGRSVMQKHKAKQEIGNGHYESIGSLSASLKTELANQKSDIANFQKLEDIQTEKEKLAKEYEEMEKRKPESYDVLAKEGHKKGDRFAELYGALPKEMISSEGAFLLNELRNLDLDGKVFKEKAASYERLEAASKKISDREPDLVKAAAIFESKSIESGEKKYQLLSLSTEAVKELSDIKKTLKTEKAAFPESCQELYDEKMGQVEERIKMAQSYLEYYALEETIAKEDLGKYVQLTEEGELILTPAYQKLNEREQVDVMMKIRESRQEVMAQIEELSALPHEKAYLEGKRLMASGDPYAAKEELLKFMKYGGEKPEDKVIECKELLKQIMLFQYKQMEHDIQLIEHSHDSAWKNHGEDMLGAYRIKVQKKTLKLVKTYIESGSYLSIEEIQKELSESAEKFGKEPTGIDDEVLRTQAWFKENDSTYN
ncbi:hypothetical protein GF376_00795, partial [Candidatus Peregrinibacteria bacterium]|nr:hypothetical protein [Candidatus Peregrinibacteria bacterium]